MLKTILYSAVLTALLLVVSIPDVASYTKYGRNCKDIGCRSDEVCVIAEDPCTIYSQDKCGHYPTCKKKNTGEAGCESIICPPNDYCKTENGVPKCVSKVASNVPYQRPGQRQPYYPRVRPTPPTPPPRAYGPGRSSGRSGARNTIGDNSVWNRLFDGRDNRYNSRSTDRNNNRRAGNDYYNTHTSTDKHGNRVWTFSH